jgi:hypothetical protein
VSVGAGVSDRQMQAQQHLPPVQGTLDAETSAIGGDGPGYPRRGDLTTTLALAFLCTLNRIPKTTGY